MLRALAAAFLLAVVVTPLSAEVLDKSRNIGGTTVHYKVILPKQYDRTKEYPGVLAFGGGPQTMDVVEGTIMRNWRAEAERRGCSISLNKPGRAAPNEIPPEQHIIEGAMDMERSIEFLIESAARHEGQLQRIRDLIEGGIKLVVASYSELNRKTDALLDAQLRTETSVARLAEAQRVTEEKLQGLIESLKNPRNGHN
ncbi:MAG TPA: hypothetical protein VN841_23365 [Bryobacteraceae bacterium]|nr:hypothetical protein [Bryobacteraceae bacterium]